MRSYIKSLVSKGHTVDVISLKEERQDPFLSEEDGFANYKVATRYIGSSFFSYILYYSLFALRSFSVVTVLALRKKIHVVHYNNLPNFPVFAALVPRLFGAKVILDNHDLITVMFTSKFATMPFGGLFNRLLRLEERLSMAFAQTVIVADHNQRDTLVGHGICAKKVHVILNVANEQWFYPIPELRDDMKEFRLIYHGTIAERLGLDLAIRAVDMARKKIPRLKFHLIGKGDFLAQCLSLVDKLGLRYHVLPSKCFYPVEQLSDIISKMDVGVIPNRKTQATDKYMLPVKLLEYVYMQKPVIAPRLKIIERYFDETMIKYFEPENVEDLARCIVELYENPEERKSLVNKANKFIKKYNWKTQEKEYLKLILSGKHTN
ncbi:MAG: glycosyltransferase family 4 protein [Desulfobulbaceae bacterium]|nr:glycosyltransferase family 4 protein [Desulfobulbaceae bacterium]